MVNLLTLMTDEGEFAPDFDDEIVAGAAVTHDGRIVHEPTREAIEGPRLRRPRARKAEEAETQTPSGAGLETNDPRTRRPA